MSYNNYDYITDYGNRRPRNSDPTFGIILLILSPVIGWVGSMIDRAGGVVNFTLGVTGIVAFAFTFISAMLLLAKFEKRVKEKGTKKQKTTLYIFEALAIITPLLFTAYLIAFCR